jgi:hypothetical protein
MPPSPIPTGGDHKPNLQMSSVTADWNSGQDLYFNIRSMMLKFSHILFLFFILSAGLSCEEDCKCAGTGQFDYMVFGHFYGECAGEDCVEIYKFDAEHLYEDSTDVYPNGLAAYAGEYYTLPDSKFQAVKDLLNAFPEELYEESNTVIGMPDAADWGGIYVEVKFENNPSMSGFWLLDQNESFMPQVYNDFVDRINEKIALIHQ